MPHERSARRNPEGASPFTEAKRACGIQQHPRSAVLDGSTLTFEPARAVRDAGGRQARHTSPTGRASSLWFCGHRTSVAASVRTSVHDGRDRRPVGARLSSAKEGSDRRRGAARDAYTDSDRRARGDPRLDRRHPTDDGIDLLEPVPAPNVPYERSDPFILVHEATMPITPERSEVDRSSRMGRGCIPSRTLPGRTPGLLRGFCDAYNPWTQFPDAVTRNVTRNGRQTGDSEHEIGEKSDGC